MGESGRSFLSAFTQGMLDSVADLKESVGKVFAVIARFLPHSDADEGPLSQITKSGRAFVTTFALGMNSAKDLIDGSIGKVFAKSKEQFLQSNAKRGAFTNLTGSGKALVETFSEGIQSSEGLLNLILGKFSISKTIDPVMGTGNNIVNNESNSRQIAIQTNKLVEIIINDSSLNLSPEHLGKLLLNAINKEISRYEVFV